MGDARVEVDSGLADGGEHQRCAHLAGLGGIDFGARLAVDGDAGRLQRSGGRADHVEHLLVDRAERIVQPGGDAQRTHVVRSWGEIDRPRLFAGEDAEQEFEILGGAGDRSHDVDVGLGGAAQLVVEIASAGDDAVAGLVAEDAAEGGGEADGAADVGADLERGEPGRDGGSGAPGRAAGHAILVPGIDRGAKDFVERLGVARPTGEIGFAHDNGAGLFDRRHGRGVALRDVIRQLGRPAGRAHALGFERVLDRDGQTVQRSQLLAGRDGGIGGGCSAACPFDVLSNDRVEFRVDALRTGEEVFE